MSAEKIARYKPGDNVTVRPNGEEAADKLSAGRFVTVVDIGTDRCYLAEHSAAGEAHPFGVTQRESADPSKEDPRSVDLLVECVRTGAIALVEAAVTIEAGEEVGSNKDGEAVKAVASSEAEIKEGKPDYKVAPVGRALSSGEKGDFVEVDLY